jgi:solute carrier family 25 uncoupling protein 8/9
MCVSFHLTGYDGLKTMAKNRGYEDNVYLHVASGISASFWASFLSAPADLVMAKYMSSKSKESLGNCVKEIYVKNGIIGFWRGWSLFFMRLTPSLLTYSTVYEQLRHNLGLGYFE